MKAMRAVLFFFLLTPLGRLWAQEYIPFPDSNATWFCQKATDYCFDIAPSENQVYSYEIMGDTLITGLAYHKLAVTNYCVECCDVPLLIGYAGAFRNDIDSRKVFLVLPDSAQEVVWYDFSAQLGDTLEFSLPLWTGTCTQFMLTGLDSVVVAGAYRRAFKWTSIDGCWESQDVEGMGSLNGLFERNMAALDINGFLHCFKLDGEEVWSDGLDMCSIPTVVTTTGQEGSDLMAMIQAGSIVLTRRGQATLNGMVAISDGGGRTVVSARVAGIGTASVALPDLRSGVYIFRFHGDDRPVAEVLRLVIQ